MRWSFDVGDVRVELAPRPARWPDCQRMRHMPFHLRIVRGLEGLVPLAVHLAPVPGTGTASRWPSPAHSVGRDAMVLSRRVTQATITHAMSAPVWRVDWEASRPLLEALRLASGPRASPLSACLAQEARERSAAESVRPLSETVKRLAPGLDEAVWKDMQAQRPIEAGCLSRMLVRLMTPGSDFWRAKPQDRACYGQRLYGVLHTMAQEWSRQPGAATPFTDDILSSAKRSLGTDESLLLHPLHNLLPAMRGLGFEVVEPLSQRDLAAMWAARNGVEDLPPPFCLRVTAKWALCAAVDAPFRHRQLSMESTQRKQERYTSDNIIYQLINRGTTKLGKVELDSVQAWARRFHDADGIAHDDAVVVAGPHPIAGVDYLSQRRLGEGEVALLIYHAHKPDGTINSHVIGFSGGTPGVLFDAETGSFSGRPADPGLLMAQYLKTAYPHLDSCRTEWFVITIRRKEAGMNEAAGSVMIAPAPPAPTDADMTLPPKNVSLAEWFNSSKENGNDEDDEGALHARVQARSGATGRGWSEHCSGRQDAGRGRADAAQLGQGAPAGQAQGR